MRFLVIDKDIDHGVLVDPIDLAILLENVTLPSLKMLKNWEKDKKSLAAFSQPKEQEQ